MNLNTESEIGNGNAGQRLAASGGLMGLSAEDRVCLIHILSVAQGYLESVASSGDLRTWHAGCEALLGTRYPKDLAGVQSRPPDAPDELKGKWFLVPDFGIALQKSAPPSVSKPSHDGQGRPDNSSVR